MRMVTTTVSPISKSKSFWRLYLFSTASIKGFLIGGASLSNSLRNPLRRAAVLIQQVGTPPTRPMFRLRPTPCFDIGMIAVQQNVGHAVSAKLPRTSILGIFQPDYPEKTRRSGPSSLPRAPGRSRTTLSRTAKAAISPPVSTKSPKLISLGFEQLYDPFVVAFVMSA